MRVKCGVLEQTQGLHLRAVVKVKGNVGNAVPGPLNIAGERSQSLHSR